MGKILLSLLVFMLCINANAETFSYSFKSIPLSEALIIINNDHPELNINFIYDELENYIVNSQVDSHNAYEALSQVIGRNPVTIRRKKDVFYIEALQHGKYIYKGMVKGNDGLPVVAATVLMMTPKDSTVLTYGITDDDGRFSIPCDKPEVIAKLSCLGYKTTYYNLDKFAVGVLKMDELPIELKGIKVKGDDMSIYSDKSVYVPTTRQKNASQTAYDLIGRLSMAQLSPMIGTTQIQTVAGEDVAVYIDSVPATSDQLKMMRISDVKRVEYFDFPKDSRFSGNRHVINFIMTKYEYGGYAKVRAKEQFIINSGDLQGNIRFVYKKMTYDLMGYAAYDNNKHIGYYETESFTLPDESVGHRTFYRISDTRSGRYRKNNYNVAFRALYNSSKVTSNNNLTFGLQKMPENFQKGYVSYTPNVYESSLFESNRNERSKFIDYSGSLYVKINPKTSVSLSASYNYSNTKELSDYHEEGFDNIVNDAYDNSNSGSLYLSLSHTLNTSNSISVFGRGMLEENRTNYSGNLNIFDRSITRFALSGVSYDYYKGGFSGGLSFGWSWIGTFLNSKHSKSNQPFADGYLNYRFNPKNSVNLYFHHANFPPSTNSKSENVIKVSPFLSLTGNPFLKATHSIDMGGSYLLRPTKKFRTSLFTHVCIVGNRIAYDYEATEEGIIRKIIQPAGKYNTFNLGINGTLSLLDNNLILSGSTSYQSVSYGHPNNVSYRFLKYSLQAQYYYIQFNFTVSYLSRDYSGYYNPESGLKTKERDNLILQAGWSNSDFNVSLMLRNPQRWNWKSSVQELISPYYSYTKQMYGATSHAMVQISATYSFGYGKKIKSGNDLNSRNSTTSGILK